MLYEGKVFLGTNIHLIISNEHCEVYKVQNSTGEGLMTCYHLLPGIVMMHCDIHMLYYRSDLQAMTEMFSLDHCREGRMECQLVSGPVLYLDAGSALVHDSEGFHPDFVCPTSHFHGLTIVFFIEEAQRSLKAMFDDFDVDLQSIRNKFCGDRPPFILPKGKLPEQIFNSLYEVAGGAGTSLHRLKVMEILLLLDELDVSEVAKTPYFYKTQVEKAKAIERYLSENLSRHHTIEDLSLRFGFPATSMKLCFKGVFGSSIYAYVRNQRMSTAAMMLRQSQARVTDIAAAVGYENASKFSKAFRAVMGASPNEYRKQSVESAIQQAKEGSHV
ncbi:MAG: AraC family transcriptional regulator [Coriobacteriales bacterium]|jgi:AraC-like DNA-binding protein|nr:AraC family transcriptional regulator [Coriobacteriales bacterium]